MACFCHIPATTQLPSYAKMRLQFTPPTIPLQMKLGLALGLGSSTRLDMSMAAWMGSVSLPNIMLTPGPLLQMNLALGMFDLFDLPKLQAQLQMASDSFYTNVWPKIAFLAKINFMPILQLAAIARLQLALDKIGVNLAAGYPAPSSASMNLRFALTPPQVHMGQMLLALPIALKFQAALGGFGAMTSYFNAMAGLKMPTLGLGLSFPLILRLALVLEAIMTIQAAFGIDALSSSGLSQIAATLKLYLGLPLPSPLPPLDLAMKLPDLPSLPDLQAAAGSAPSSFALQMPAIPIMVAINAMVALNATLNLPLNACSGGACPFGA